MAGILGLLLSGAQVIRDQYYNLTSLLLPGNGTNGATNNSFLDSSSNTFTVTRNGNTTQGSFSPFSQTGWSNYFAGGGNYLTVADSAAFDLPGDFTIEFEVYPLTRNNALFGLGDYRTANNGMSLYYDIGTGTLRLYSNGADVLIGASAVPLNQWSHIALVRSGTATNNLKLYINGQFDTQGTTNASFTGVAGNGVSINVDYGGSYQGTGPTDYISNVRIVKGQALTSGNFTPPTASLTTTSVGWSGANAASTLTGTISLLICQSNRFRDASGNGFTVTPTGSPSVAPFSPFAPTAAYSTSVVGGSGYFDGNGDYLEAAYNSAFDMGTGNFTAEFYVYTQDQSNSYPGILANSTYNATGAVNIRYDNTGNANKFFVYLFGASPADPAITSGTYGFNQWVHVALVRDSSTSLKLYVNGVLDGSQTISSGQTVSFGSVVSTALRVGRGFDVDGANGYYAGTISNIRIVKGQALASGNFTPPTAPVTSSAVGWTGANAAGSLTGTVSLLLNFTNAGIFDATAKNDLETVGNAQISTTQSKWGGGSMLFNGTTDYLKSPASSVYSFGTGDWTIEFWYYQTAVTGTPRAFSINGIECPITTSGIGLYDASAALIAITGSSSLNTWSYYCACRVSGTIRLFKDGNLVGSVANSTNYNSLSYATSAGAKYNGADFFQGYLDDIRTSSYGRYVEGTGGNAGKMVFNGTNTLALPTAPFPVQ